MYRSQYSLSLFRQVSIELNISFLLNFVCFYLIWMFSLRTYELHCSLRVCDNILFPFFYLNWLEMIVKVTQLGSSDSFIDTFFIVMSKVLWCMIFVKRSKLEHLKEATCVMHLWKKPKTFCVVLSNIKSNGQIYFVEDPRV